jgi:hypothetical protein
MNLRISQEQKYKSFYFLFIELDIKLLRDEKRKLSELG